MRLTTGRRLPRSIVLGLLRDQFWRCVEEHRKLMIDEEPDRPDVKRTYDKMEKAHKLYMAECIKEDEHIKF